LEINPEVSPQVVICAVSMQQILYRMFIGCLGFALYMFPGPLPSANWGCLQHGVTRLLYMS
jgi:hypothetical protein